MFEKLGSILKKKKEIPSSIEKQEQLKVDLVARYCNGNVSLQRGNFITQTELAKKEQGIFAHRFV
ncbi:hypothetical protein [Chrysiogenes arsenatis]|uniref:hypothetical protein n=1 Tax=Chrysiogenes arsenatis TaxID=309797 RepID=UPI0004258CBB|nr:hypothetical protein [Chrysiogenes arsenatis]